MTVEESQQVEYGTFEASLERSKRMEADLLVNPGKYRMLTGDRPTGRLHVGHLFGSIQNRVRLQNLGIEVFVVIADYQVLTDRDEATSIAENVKQLTIDYLACGLDPEKGNTVIFAHSHVPELNQLL
jgi:tryptophanyl-tRNA synthetase